MQNITTNVLKLEGIKHNTVQISYNENHVSVEKTRKFIIIICTCNIHVHELWFCAEIGPTFVSDQYFLHMGQQTALIFWMTTLLLFHINYPKCINSGQVCSGLFLLILIIFLSLRLIVISYIYFVFILL